MHSSSLPIQSKWCMLLLLWHDWLTWFLDSCFRIFKTQIRVFRGSFVCAIILHHGDETKSNNRWWWCRWNPTYAMATSRNVVMKWPQWSMYTWNHDLSKGWGADEFKHCLFQFSLPRTTSNPWFSQSN
jgi:hypothetical protein